MQEKTARKSMLYKVRRNKATRIHFIFDYTPKANQFFGKDFNPEVYNFKYFGHDMEDFKIIIECMVEILECNTSVGIPSSETGENNVQKICKKDIVFIPQYKRPGRHNYHYQLTLGKERERLRIEKKKDSERVLLVDDIVTTGRTMRIYRDILSSMGIKEIKMFAFAHKTGEAEIKHAIYLRDNFDLDIELDKDFNLDISEVS